MLDEDEYFETGNVDSVVILRRWLLENKSEHDHKS